MQTTILFGCAVTLLVFTASLTWKERLTERLVKVNLEPGEALLYQAEQVLEVRSGELQRGTLGAIVALQVKNKTSDEYWFVFKIVSINAEGENLEKIGNVTRGSSSYFLVRVERTSRSEVKKTSKYTNADEFFELYGNQQSDAESARYARAILTQLLPTVERNLYERVDGEKPDPNSEPKPEKSSLFPGIVKMHREANTLENDEIFIINKFNRSDVTNMTSDIDLDISYADYSVLNKSNGVVTKGEVHLTLQLDFREPVRFKKGSTANMMSASFTSKVTLLIDEKSRRSYLEDEELADVDVRDFAKLFTQKSDQIFTEKISEREVLNEPSFDSNLLNTTSACEDERETNLATALHASRHRIHRQSSFPQILKAPREIKFKVFEKKVFGTIMKVETTIHIASIEKFHIVKLDEIVLELTLQLGSSSKMKLFRYSIDTTKMETKMIYEMNIKDGYSIPIFWVVNLDLEFLLRIQASIAVNTGTPSPSRLSVTVTPSASVTTSLQGSVSVWPIRAGVYGDEGLIRGSLPISVSYDENRPSNRDACVDVSVDLRLLELEAGVFYQWKSWKIRWLSINYDWSTRHILFSSTRRPVYSLRQNIRYECY